MSRCPEDSRAVSGVSEAPDPRELSAMVRKLEIRSRRLVNELFSGEYHSSFKGRGIEFSQVREYQYGDDVRTVDWNTSAHKNDLYVKMFTEERERILMLVLDGSGSMLFGSGRLKKELAAEVSAILAFSAVQNNDMVGLLVFTDKVETYIPPRKGRAHALVILNEIFSLRQCGRKTDIDAALSFIRRTQKRKAIIFLLTDLLGSEYERGMKLLNIRHDFVLIHIGDPLDREFPRAGLLDLVDPETGERMTIDAGSRAFLARYATERQREREAVQRQLSRMKVDAVFLDTGKSIIGGLNAFFRHRERRV
ncbi:hypothetical protein BIU88_11385 [Chlorobaculum limnaeum]|uniref:VWFA domain-containing protein n=1 Tax=Chlorobaculum limnaeum TaxID=274537 RepID=A0A1D8D0G1_CHLLM|nr:DUF58 domain-containing protein [Chlorobaculum limnaeum]AOS84680.1 hypothetical protein BIU88_11385 [Chlorobaculum limnaeum]